MSYSIPTCGLAKDQTELFVAVSTVYTPELILLKGGEGKAWCLAGDRKTGLDILVRLQAQKQDMGFYLYAQVSLTIAEFAEPNNTSSIAYCIREAAAAIHTLRVRGWDQAQVYQMLYEGTAILDNANKMEVLQGTRSY